MSPGGKITKGSTIKLQMRLMQTLKDILFGVSLRSLTGNRDEKIAGIAFDSREVKKGYLFVAVKGLTVDGHDFIESAIKNGANVIICEQLHENLGDDITVVQTDHSAEALGIIASNFYGRPSEKLSLLVSLAQTARPHVQHYYSSFSKTWAIRWVCFQQ